MAEQISKVIFQLDMEAQGVFTELNKVASKYKEVTTQVDKQNDEIEKLTKREKELTAQRAKSTNPTAIVKLNAEIKKTQDLLTKEIAQQKELNKTLDHYDDTVDGLEGKLQSAFNKQILASFEQQLSEIQNEQQQLNDTISDKKPLSALQALKKEYKDLISQAIQAGEETDIGQQFLKQAGEVKDRIGDIQDTVSRFASDTGVFDGVIGGIQGVAAGFEIAQGAAALFGDENEDVQKALLKVNAAMAIANGLQQIQALLQKESAFRIQATAAAQKLYNLAVGEGTKATKLLNGALKVGAIGAVIFLLQKFSKEIEDLGEKFKNSKLGKFITDSFRDLDKESQDALTRQIENSKLAIANVESEFRRRIELAKANKEETEALEQEKLNRQLAIINDVNSTIEGATKGHLFVLTEEQKKAAKELIEQTKDLNNEVAVIQAEADQRRLEELRRIAEANRQLAREIEDIEIELIKDQRTRDLAKIRLDTERRKQDVLDTIASEEEKAKAIVAIEKDRIRQIEQLEDIHLQRVLTNIQKERELRTDLPALEDPEFENRRAALREQRRREQLEKDIEAINTVTNALANAAQTAISIEVKKQDALIEIQNKRVQQASLIAERGNAELLQQEQERLDALQKKREAFVRAQQILQQVEIVGNSIVAVSKAAAQGGVAAPATIAATIAALIAGYALVRTLTQPEGFREGGYTGDGDPSHESKALGNRGYKYHKKEFVFNEDATRKNLSTFKKIHRGELDLNSTVEKAKLFDQIPMPILNNLLLGQAMRTAHNNIDTSRMENIMLSVEKTIKKKSDATFIFNERGYLRHMKDVIYREDRIKQKAG